jgi:hypothetical protein
VSAEEATLAEGTKLWQGEYDLLRDSRRGAQGTLWGGTVADTASSVSGCAIKAKL